MSKPTLHLQSQSALDMVETNLKHERQMSKSKDTSKIKNSDLEFMKSLRSTGIEAKQELTIKLKQKLLDNQKQGQSINDTAKKIEAEQIQINIKKQTESKK